MEFEAVGIFFALLTVSILSWGYLDIVTRGNLSFPHSFGVKVSGAIALAVLAWTFLSPAPSGAGVLASDAGSRRSSPSPSRKPAKSGVVGINVKHLPVSVAALIPKGSVQCRKDAICDIYSNALSESDDAIVTSFALANEVQQRTHRAQQLVLIHDGSATQKLPIQLKEPQETQGRAALSAVFARSVPLDVDNNTVPDKLFHKLTFSYYNATALLAAPSPPFDQRLNAIAAFVSARDCTADGKKWATFAFFFGEKMPVHSFGSCFFNRRLEREYPDCVPAGRKYTADDVHDAAVQACVLRHYKFAFVLEPVILEESLVTAQLFTTIAAGAIPLYWGCPHVQQLFNYQLAGSPWRGMLDISDYIKGTQEAWKPLVNKIVKTMQQQHVWDQSHLFRRTGPSDALKQYLSTSIAPPDFPCRLCEVVAAHLAQSKNERKRSGW